ncbi:vomeronasal type-2 receptor 116-like [Dipodomys merriami]|uniref:vomeronasal type-2 receptor 116-like n=1 Tax=Dipodomys merriami TaxID=94247 RepID=UPI003855A506
MAAAVVAATAAAAVAAAGKSTFKNYQFVLAVAFAIEEINKNPKLLHNLTLGFDIYDVQYGIWTEFKNPFTCLFGKYKIPNYNCMSENKFIAVLTGPSGAMSSQIATLLNIYKFPQLSFGPFDYALNDKNKFPGLYQMASKDTSVAKAIVLLLLHFSWNWVSLLTLEDENSLWILPELKEEMAKNRVYSQSDCPHEASLDWLPMHIFGVTMSGDSYNIYNAVYAVAQALHEMLLHQTEAKTVENKKGRMPYTAQLHPILKDIQFYNPVGDQVILNDKRKLEAKYDIVNIWKFPEGLEMKVKVGKFSSHMQHGHQLYLSEDMVEWAIETTEPPHSVCSESCGPGFRKSPQEGKMACCFDCMSCSENEIANSTDMEQCVNCPFHQYANRERNQCLQRAESFLAYGEPLGMALACMALCLCSLTAFILGVFVKHHNTPIVKANNQALSYTLLISLIFCFLCSLLFIGRPNKVTCILQQTTFGVAFTVAVSAVLAKTVTVVLAFKVTSRGKRMRWLLLSGAPNFIIPICTLIQVILSVLWLRTSPPFIETDIQSEHSHIIILCNKGSLKAFYCFLGYMFCLALGSFMVAFLARNLPDTFNEAKFLTFSMLVFCSVWLTFLPVYHSVKGKIMVTIEIFSILTSSAGLLGCIFVPKCYIILLRPERNFLHGCEPELSQCEQRGGAYWVSSVCQLVRSLPMAYPSAEQQGLPVCTHQHLGLGVALDILQDFSLHPSQRFLPGAFLWASRCTHHHPDLLMECRFCGACATVRDFFSFHHQGLTLHLPSSRTSLIFQHHKDLNLPLSWAEIFLSGTGKTPQGMHQRAPLPRILVSFLGHQPSLSSISGRPLLFFSPCQPSAAHGCHVFSSLARPSTGLGKVKSRLGRPSLRRVSLTQPGLLCLQDRNCDLSLSLQSPYKGLSMDYPV